jgi:hypothetical protein
MVVRRIVVCSFVLAFAGAASAQTQPAPAQDTRAVEGDTLLIERVQEENKAAMPARGMTMQQVEARFGAPGDRLDPRGGQKRQWPTINRWTYPAFTVYFEKNKVIDAVATKADAGEVGPKPAIK